MITRTVEGCILIQSMYHKRVPSWSTLSMGNKLFSAMIGAIFDSLKWLLEQQNWLLDMLSCKSTQFGTIWQFRFGESSAKLADLDQSLNLCMLWVYLAT